MVYIVQPWADGPERFHKATIISSHPTAVEGYAELQRRSPRSIWRVKTV
jgi:hypothetical protein